MTDQQRVMAAIESSLIISVCDRLLARLWDAGRASRTASLTVSVMSIIKGLPPPVLQQAIGILLLTATAVHVLLMLMLGSRDSWLWPLLPSIAAATGAILLVSARQRQPGVRP